ncbi:MAG TPA: O-methyltransferase [Chitinophagaceae bacterium]|nr:O-methyltransferase [Chitinophagaceae bacterium]
MELINKTAEDYAQNFSSKEEKLLAEIAAFANNHPQAIMLSGHVQGKILETISCLLQPKRILEIGTFVGYSALCLAKGLHPDGILHTIELREEDAQTARNFFSKSLQNNKIVLHVANALELIPTLHEEWDIVFIDADKVGYIDYYELTLPQVKPNGLIIADNVLFHGEVLEEDIKGKNAKAIHAFNEHVANDKRVEQVMLTVRDGLFIIRKL